MLKAFLPEHHHIWRFARIPGIGCIVVYFLTCSIMVQKEYPPDHRGRTQEQGDRNIATFVCFYQRHPCRLMFLLGSFFAKYTHKKIPDFQEKFRF